MCARDTNLRHHPAAVCQVSRETLVSGGPNQGTDDPVSHTWVLRSIIGTVAVLLRWGRTVCIERMAQPCKTLTLSAVRIFARGYLYVAAVLQGTLRRSVLVQQPDGTDPQQEVAEPKETVSISDAEDASGGPE